MAVELDSEQSHYEAMRAALGAYRSEHQRRFTIYLPDKTSSGAPVEEWHTWIRRASQLLADINGGMTRLPAAAGMWRNKTINRAIEERTVLVYSFIDPSRFFDRLPEVREFLHRFGRAAEQQEVLVEYGAAAYWIEVSATDN
jgi:hypothetical protein